MVKTDKKETTPFYRGGHSSRERTKRFNRVFRAL